jgi:hypothetical protein
VSAGILPQASGWNQSKKKKGKFVPLHTMKDTGGIDVKLFSFLTLALDGGEWLTSQPGRFTPGKEPRNLLNKMLGWPHSWARRLVKRFRRLVASLSPRRPGFDPRSVHVGFVVEKVALGQVFPRLLQFSPVSFIPPVLHYLKKKINKKTNHLHHRVAQ